MEFDRYYLTRCLGLASRSNDPSSKFGCVVLDAQGIPAGEGFNGFPPGVAEDERMLIREVKYELVVHSEVRAIISALSQGRDIRDGTLYCNGVPCCRCAVTIIEVGIKRVVAFKPTADYLSRWRGSYERTCSIFREANVNLFEIGEL